jgi:hypothetical protein
MNGQQTPKHPNKRFLRGRRRIQLAEQLYDTAETANEMYLWLLGKMSPEECMAGNATQCQFSGFI